jgi:hypothetical protein
MDSVGDSGAQKSAIWGSRRSSRTLVEEQLLSYSDIVETTYVHRSVRTRPGKTIRIHAMPFEIKGYDPPL